MDLRTKVYPNEYYVAMLKTPRDRVLCVDTETTGLDPSKDNNEILQLAMVDGNGKVLFSSYIRPKARKRWPKAAEVNHITWVMVKDQPTMDDVHDEVQAIMDGAYVLMGYNVDFDMEFLKAAGIHIGNEHLKIYDVMEDYARTFGEWNPKYGEYKWEKLSRAKSRYGIRHKSHDAEGDAKATVEVFYRMMGDSAFTMLPDHVPAKLSTPAASKESGPVKTVNGIGSIVGCLAVVAILLLLLVLCVAIVL